MTDIVQRNAHAVGIDVGATEWNQLIREQLAPEITDPELVMFAEVCKRTNLEPFAAPRQIYPVMRYDGRLKRKKMVIQTGIDGFRAVAERTGAYAGSDDAEFEGVIDGTDWPAIAKVTVWKIVQGQRVPFTASARWSEFYPGDKQGNMWKRMPHVMLSKVAEAAALRKGFPQQLGSLYSDAEMGQADADEITDEDREALVDLAVASGLVPAAARARAMKVRTRDQYDRSVARLETLVAERNETVDVEAEPAEDGGDDE